MFNMRSLPNAPRRHFCVSSAFPQGAPDAAGAIWTGAGDSVIGNGTVRRSASACGFLSRGLRPSRSDGAAAAAFQTQESGVQVLVRDNNVDQALKALKKKMQREGIFREMKLRGHYEKPSEKRAREQAEAVRRARKLARKKMQREGLLPMKGKVAAR
jgi:small subunit ribosomal protein S21